jgi:hypothetical protein
MDGRTPTRHPLRRLPYRRWSSLYREGRGIGSAGIVTTVSDGSWVMHEWISVVTLLSVFLIHNSHIATARLYFLLRRGAATGARNKTASEKVLPAGNLTEQS